MSAKRAAVVTLAVLIVTCFSSATLGQESITEVVQKVKPAVVTIITYDDAGKVDGQGTGFLVQAGHVITSYHVVENAAKAEVKSADGKTYKVKGISGLDELADIARLVLAEPVKNAKVLTLAKTLPREGDRVVVVGSPLGLEHTVSDGIVSAVRDIPGVGKFIQVTAPISPGSSGSPVVNLEGEVVGVACGMLTEGQSLNFAVASEHVLALKATETAALGERGPRTKDEASSHLEKARYYVLKDQYADALPHLKAAVEADPLNEQAWVLAGLAYDEVGQDSEAIEAYKRAIHIRPDDANAHLLLGTVYFYLDQYSEAVAAYKQAIRIEPDDAGGHFLLGLAYGQMGRHSEAIAAYKQAIRVKPDDGEAHYWLGISYQELGRYSEAIAAYKQAIRVKPEDALPHYDLGRAYVDLGRYSEAKDAFKQAIRIEPDNAKAHFGLGMTYVMTNSTGPALQEYKILKMLDMERANMLFDLLYE